jgi:hypothetical protein
MLWNSPAMCIVVVMLAGIVSAQETAHPLKNESHYTKAEVKQLARNAHTPEEYLSLSRYYDEQQQSFLKQAAEVKQEWNRRSQNVAGIGAMYPRPVDSARNLYEYYVYEASESGNLSAKYARRGATPNSTQPQ